MYSLALTEGASVRTTRHDQDAAAVDDLDAALRELGVPFERSSDVDLVIRPGRRRVPVTLHSMAVASASSVAGPISDATPRKLHVLVADRISRDARALLDAAGWGWLDRRGELALRVGDDYLIRSHVAPRLERGSLTVLADRSAAEPESRTSRPRSNDPTKRPCCAPSRGEPGSATSHCRTPARR